MNRYTKEWCLAALAAGMMMTTACDLRATQEGEQGNLQFYYTPADGSTTFDRPIAVGSSMTIYVEPIGDNQFEEVTDVSVDRTSVLEAVVANDEYNAMWLLGLASGNASLHVDARGGGERYSDNTTIRVDDVDHIKMAHHCTSQPDAAYLVGYPVDVELERRNRSGEKLVGAAQSSNDSLWTCQVDIYPGEFQDDPFCDEAGLHFSSIHSLGPVDVFPAEGIGVANSGVDDMGIHIIDPAVLDFGPTSGDLRLDSNRTVALDPFTNPPGGPQTWPVCTHMELHVSILTPSTCSGPSGQLDFYIDHEDENEIPLRGEGLGTCDFEVTVPNRSELWWAFSAPVYE